MYPTSYISDLRSDGKTQQSLTPGSTEQSVSFLIQAQKGNVDKSWAVARGVCGRLAIGFDQAASGGSAVDWDDLFSVIGGIEVKSDVFGTMYSKEVTAGQILKNLSEFISQGYTYGDYARAQIASSDGDTAVHLYFTIPIRHEYMTRPEDTAIWLGWLANTEIKFYLAVSTALDAFSTGAVTEATCNLQMWVEYDVVNELDIPVIPNWTLHTQAAGGTEFLMRGVGAANGLKGVVEGNAGGYRLAGLFELCDNGGMGGSSTADNYTEIELQQFGQDRIVNVDGLFYRYNKTLRGRRGPIVAATDSSGKSVEPLTATGNGKLNSSTAKYIPLMAPSLNQQLTKLPKFYGDLKRVCSYTTAVSSGTHKAVSHGFYELSPAAKGELMARARRPAGAYRLRKIFADDNGREEHADLGDAGLAGRARVLPDRVIRNGK